MINGVKYSSDDIEIDEMGSEFMVKARDIATAFGETVVEDGIFVWKIETILNTIDSDDEGPYVGVILMMKKI